MLGKLIKHDLNYSKKSFFSIAVIIMTISIVGALSMTLNDENISNFFSVTLVIAITTAIIVSIGTLFNGYRKSLFGQNGYLFLTLPVSKMHFLLSKVIGALLWFNFMLAVTLITMAAVMFISLNANADFITISIDWDMTSLLEMIRQLFVSFAVSNASGFVVITTLFMAVTLSNTSFNGKRIHGLLAGGIGVIYYVLYVRGVVFVGNLFDIATNHIAGAIVFTVYGLVIGTIGYLITLYLLENRIELE